MCDQWQDLEDMRIQVGQYVYDGNPYANNVIRDALIDIILILQETLPSSARSGSGGGRGEQQTEHSPFAPQVFDTSV